MHQSRPGQALQQARFARGQFAGSGVDASQLPGLRIQCDQVGRAFDAFLHRLPQPGTCGRAVVLGIARAPAGGRRHTHADRQRRG